MARQHSIRWASLLVLVVHFLLSASVWADDSELWVSGNYRFWQSEDKQTKASFYSEARFQDDMGSLYGAFAGPTLRHNVNRYLQAGAAFKFITFRNGSGVFDPRTRIELELTPKFRFGKKEQYQISLRNRFELFHNKGVDDIRRLRYRLEFSRNIDGNELINGIYTSQEWVYRRTDGSYGLNQYRFIPIGLKLKPSSDYSMKVFYMLYRRNSGLYSHNLGMSFSF